MTQTRRDFLSHIGCAGLATYTGFAFPNFIAGLAVAQDARSSHASEIYGRLAGALVTADDPEHQKSALGLFMTAGVAERYTRGEIDANEARRQIELITGSGQIPDATALKTVSDALNGSQLLDELSDRVLGESFNLLGMTRPLFTPAGAAVVTIASQYGAPLVRYLNDPDNILTGQFAPPRPDPIQLAGAAVMARLHQMVRDKAELAEIYKQVVPQVAERLRIGGEPEKLAGEMSGELRDLIVAAVKANRDHLPAALANLETGIFKRLGTLETTSKEILGILKRELKERDRREKLEAIRRQERFIQQEVSGAITLVDAFTRHVIGDARAANIATGCLRAAQSGYQLVSGFIAGSIGVLGFAGGMATVLSGLFNLFGDRIQNQTLRRLDEIDRKLERLTQILIDGLKHLDRRMTQLLDLSHDILRQVVEQAAIERRLLMGLDEQVKRLEDFVIAAARGNVERPFIHLANQLRNQVVAKKSLEPQAIEYLTTLATHANDDSRRPEMNGRIQNPSVRAISDQLLRTGDIRTFIGNLPFIARYSGVAVPESNFPDVTHWSRAVQGALELLVLAPDTHPNVVEKTLAGFWNAGNALKSAVLAATNSDCLLSLLDRYEAWAMRGRSNAGINRTADEAVQALLAAEILPGKTHRQHVEDHVLLMQDHPFFDVGTPLHYLLAVLAWRISDTNDQQAVNPRGVDIISRGAALATYLNDAMDVNPKVLEAESKRLHDEVAKLEAEGKKAEAQVKRPAADERTVEAAAWTQGVVETRDGGKKFFRQAVQNAVVRALREKLSGDIDRLRFNLPTLARSRRVRDVDEALLGVHAVCRSRRSEDGAKRLELPLPVIPLLRVSVRAEPQSVYQIDGDVFSQEVSRLCKAAGRDFSGEAGDVLDPAKGLRKLARPPLGFQGVLRPTGAPGNTEGRSTCLRLFLPEPMNWRQATDQSERYAEWISKAFDRIRDFQGLRLPLHVRQTDAPTTKKVVHRYFHRTPGPEDPACELALVTREYVVEGAGTRFAMELWVFTGRSGSILHDVK